MATWGLASMISFLTGTLIRNMPSVQHGMMDQAGVIVENEAKRVLGTYDYGWKPLSPHTIAKKEGNRDTPGLETGEMRDSVYHTVTHEGIHSAVNVGSDLDKAVWFELGTSRGQEPRPWLSVAAQNMAPVVANMCGARMHAFLQSGIVSDQHGYGEHKAAWQARQAP